ncbi:TldD/PmbA family protein [candidate division WOR-3 bacterium]|nr:TldD/PmbA family protein [candidate division WOR-3 bacterium]
MEEQLLEMARRRAEAAEVYGVDSARTVVQFRAGRLYSQETRLTRGFGLRVVSGGRVGFSSSTNPDAGAELVSAALETASLGRPARAALPGPAPGGKVALLDNRVMLASSGRMVEWGGDLAAALKSRVPDMKVDLHFGRDIREVVILNSSGVEVRYEQAVFELSVAGLLVLSDGLFWVRDYVNLSDGQPLRLEPVADRLTALARAGRRRARLATGSYPVVVMPTAVPDLLLPLEFGVNGKQREKGTTPLLGREGERILDEKLTVVDDGLRDYAAGSAPYDGEGVPRRRNVVFDKGEFCGFLFDLATAAACGTSTTGSAERDYGSTPSPGTTNIEVRPGACPPAGALAGLDEGLVVHSFIGAGQSNLAAGDVALNVSCGFKVEDGEPAGRVKDAAIAGNVYRLLAGVEAVGHEQRNLGRYLVPFLRLPDVRVATRGEA